MSDNRKQKIENSFIAVGVGALVTVGVTLGVYLYNKLKNQPEPSHTYSTKSQTCFGENSCAICFENLRIQGVKYVRLNCQHCFHEECIKNWFSSSKTCPSCRAPARTLSYC